ncbi:MAG: uroporphyrinogen-III synthase [Deltaproteobacteria bacterium]|nr:uroporphyrinogen-III synthase [Deltaproteobacteria bacterium]
MPAAQARQKRPLEGLTMLNTREQNAAGVLTDRLEEAGARVLLSPAITFAPPADWEPFDERIRGLTPDDWIVFTSVTAVNASCDRLRQTGHGTGPLKGSHVAAVGSSTAGALQQKNIRVDLVPRIFQAEGLLEDLRPLLSENSRIWFPRAEQAREVMVEQLQAAGYQVSVTPVYRTIPPPEGLSPEAREAILQGTLDWIIFTSSSTATNFSAMLDDETRQALQRRVPRVGCLGAVTADTARSLGFQVHAVPERQNLDGLVAALIDAARPTGPGKKAEEA